MARLFNRMVRLKFLKPRALGRVSHGVSKSDETDLPVSPARKHLTDGKVVRNGHLGMLILSDARDVRAQRSARSRAGPLGRVNYEATNRVRGRISVATNHGCKMVMKIGSRSTPAKSISTPASSLKLPTLGNSTYRPKCGLPVHPALRGRFWTPRSQQTTCVDFPHP